MHVKRVTVHVWVMYVYAEYLMWTECKEIKNGKYVCVCNRQEKKIGLLSPRLGAEDPMVYMCCEFMVFFWGTYWVGYSLFLQVIYLPIHCVDQAKK